MPSRLRVIYQSNTGVWIGSGALKQIVKDWPTCPWVKPLMAKKLMEWYHEQRNLNTKFYKNNYHLSIWRERRRSRRAKQVYWQAIGPRKAKEPPRKKRAMGVTTGRLGLRTGPRVVEFEVPERTWGDPAIGRWTVAAANNQQVTTLRVAAPQLANPQLFAGLRTMAEALNEPRRPYVPNLWGNFDALLAEEREPNE